MGKYRCPIVLFFMERLKRIKTKINPFGYLLFILFTTKVKHKTQPADMEYHLISDP